MLIKPCLYILCLLIISSSEYSFEIEITSPYELSNGTIILTRGIFTPITINIIPHEDYSITPLDTKIILLADSKLITLHKEYPIKTSENKVIETYIGLPCEAELTNEEISKGLYISFVSQERPDMFLSHNKHILIQNNINEFDVIVSSKQIPLKGYGALSLTKSLYFVDEVNIDITYDIYNNEFHVESPMKISSYINEDEYTHSTVKYISKGDKDISNIKLSLSITNEKLTKCYQLSPSSKELYVSVSSNTKYLKRFNERLYTLNEKYNLFAENLDLPLKEVTPQMLTSNQIKAEQFDCRIPEMNYTSKYCLNNKHLNYKIYMPNDKNFTNLTNLIDTYSRLTFEQQTVKLSSLYDNLLNQSDFMQFTLDLILFEGYIDYYDCFKEVKGFDYCLTLKQELQTNVLGMFTNFSGNNYTNYTDYYTYNQLSSDSKRVYYYGLIFTFTTLFNNVNTITKELALSITQKFSLFLSEYSTFYKQCEIFYYYRNRIDSLYKGLIEIFPNYIAYTTYNNYFSTLEELDRLYLLHHRELVTIYYFDLENYSRYSEVYGNHDGLEIFAQTSNYSMNMILSHQDFFPFEKLDSNLFLPIGISIRQKANNGVYYHQSPVLSQSGNLTITFYLSQYNSTIVSCYLYHSDNHTFSTHQIQSVYNVARNELTCTTNLFGDFVLGIGEPELIMKSVTINLIYSFTVIGTFALIALIIYGCIKKSKLFSRDFNTYIDINNNSI